MASRSGDLQAAAVAASPDKNVIEWFGPEFRSDLAFPILTEDQVERLKSYGEELRIPAHSALYKQGDRLIDMFVVLEGGVDVSVPGPDGANLVYGRHRANSFTGEFNLLNSQKAIVGASTVMDSRVLRISRGQLQRLMRAEGDIANLIVQASIWRRIGIINAASSGVTLKGMQDDAATLTLQRFFTRNSYPHQIEWVSVIDVGTSNGKRDYPQVIFPDGRVLIRPEIPELADELGITELPEPDKIYDVAVVGAGPGGLAAAVYAASEGLCTVVLEGIAPGGQAGMSSKIENYLGFPTGLSGQQLASRAQLQALKFGAHFAISRDVISIEPWNGIHRLVLAGGIAVCARAVVVASGAQYRRLELENYTRYENQGLYYAATPMESLLCRDQEVIVVGGGNSAGQASLFLSSMTKHVHHIIRRPTLGSTMSEYLVSRIESSSRITLYADSEITALDGDPRLESVTWANRKTGESTRRHVGNVFVMIGAEPNTGWLFGTVKLDGKGFILTGAGCGFESTPYATSAPGIYAVGDVRASSVKRVASAVGEGSVVISDIHRYLADLSNHLGADPDSTVSAMRLATPSKHKKL
ncbi:MAG TPA: FAD-dependent oxidoreductase [Terracidiphilus sp.]|jgi:thioredoxin reductase (NADPH)